MGCFRLAARRVLRRALLVAAWFVAGSILCGAQAASISVGAYTASASNPFVVPIIVSGAANLASFTFDLSYEPNDFVINTSCDPFAGDPYCDLFTGPVTVGPFYTSSATYPPLFLPGYIPLDAGGVQTGHLVAVEGAFQGTDPAPSGSGVLAYVEFLAVAGGSLNSSITVDGSMPSVVPEPSSVALLAAGLLTLGRLRRRHAHIRSTKRPVE